MNHLVHNLNYFKSLLKPTTKIIVMVKAFSYGLGTYEVAKILEENGVDGLGVANIFEGVELRKEGIKLPILVMKPEIESFDLMFQHDLTPVIFSIHSLTFLIEALEKEPQFDSQNPYSIHLKLDTGMHRLGFDSEELPELVTLLKGTKNILVQGIMSHLTSTDEPAHDEFTKKQIVDFEKMSSTLTNELGYTAQKHLLNSNGIIRFPEAQYDMVRLGIGLYGICSDDKTQKHLQSSSTLRSKISQIKFIPKGDTVGYNRVGKAIRTLKIATIPVGYADGLSRALSDGKWAMMVNGQPAPIIGNVCMDMTMLDVTDIDCKEGDVAYVFSDVNPINDMAQRLGTIPYEILTSYSPRVNRVFRYK